VANELPGWVLIRPDAVIAAADDVACALTGAASSEALTGQLWTLLVAPEDLTTALEAERSRARGEAWEGTLLIARRADGDRIATRIELAPLEASGGMSVLRLYPFTEASAPPVPPGHTDHTGILVTAVEAILDIDDPGHSARAALQALAGGVAFDWAIVLRFAEASDGTAGAEVVAVYPSPLAGIAPGTRWLQLDTAEASVLATGEPLLGSNNTAQPQDRSPLRRLPGFGMRTRLHVPLFSTSAFAVDGSGRVTGCVVLYRRSTQVFGAADGVLVERALARLGDRVGPPPRAGESVGGATSLIEAAPPEPVIPEAPAAAQPPPEPTTEGETRLTLLGEIVAGVAHELNNPLTAILGYTQLLESLQGSDREQAIRTIEEEAQRAARIVRNLLSFARRNDRPMQLVDVAAVLRRVTEVRRYSLEVENITLHRELEDVPAVLADESRLEEVFLNLLNNAHHALRARGGGVIIVSTRFTGDRVTVTVADNGPGVPAEIRSRIFEPFFTTREVGEGQGMGLATVYGTVTQLHGRVWVEDTPGGGATFMIELPVLPASVAATEPPDAAPGASRILVVDDEGPIRALTREILGSAGYIVDLAANGAEALHHLEQQPYDLVVADLRMPGMSGVELREAICDRWPALCDRVLFVTGDIHGAQGGSALERQGVRYLEKPFSTGALINTVREALQAVEATPGS
jgi:signal transduction histidine kinase/CheY-like chemotaxis protein